MKYLPNINFLRYFYSAGKHTSMSKAAEENFVTQSAISQGIHKLERELGKQLITDRKNLFQLTSEGKLLLEQCEEIFSLFAGIEDLFNEREGIYKGKLVLATSYSFGISLLPIYYRKLFQLHPAVQPILRLGHSGLIREFVHQGEVDFGIVLVNDDLPGFDSQEIFNGEHRLYQANDRSKPVIDRLIISEDKREDNLLLDHFRKNSDEQPPIIEVLSWEAIAGMVKQGLGIGFLPDYVAKAHGLTPFPYKLPKIPYRLLAIYSKNKKLTRNSKMFINLMREETLSSLL
jgi:DNA-binding transcriptional LysR family regulator